MNNKPHQLWKWKLSHVWRITAYPPLPPLCDPSFSSLGLKVFRGIQDAENWHSAPEGRVGRGRRMSHCVVGTLLWGPTEQWRLCVGQSSRSAILWLPLDPSVTSACTLQHYTEWVNGVTHSSVIFQKYNWSYLTAMPSSRSNVVRLG